MRWKMSFHAKSQLENRFGEIPLEESMRNAVPFGAQKGNDCFYLDDSYQIVFVVTSDSVVKTVLTKDFAIANMQMVHKNISIDFQEYKSEVDVSSVNKARAQKQQKAKEDKKRSMKAKQEQILLAAKDIKMNVNPYDFDSAGYYKKCKEVMKNYGVGGHQYMRVLETVANVA